LISELLKIRTKERANIFGLFVIVYTVLLHYFQVINCHLSTVNLCCYFAIGLSKRVTYCLQQFEAYFHRKFLFFLKY